MAKKGELNTNTGAEAVSTAPVSAVDHEDIARLAYCYWQERGCPIGSPEEDWYCAENDLRQPIAAAAAS